MRDYEYGPLNVEVSRGGIVWTAHGWVEVDPPDGIVRRDAWKFGLTKSGVTRRVRRSWERVLRREERKAASREVTRG